MHAHNIKLLYTEWINNNVLMLNTGNCTQYPMINYNGKENGKEYVCVCVCVCVIESLFCTEMNTVINQLQ